MAADTGAIARISRARQLLAEAKDLTDIKAVRDMAEAARLYARAVGLGQDAMNEAAEVKLRAERMAGETLRDMDKAKPGPSPKIDSLPESISRPPRLADIGITPKQSMNWQAEASLPVVEFERHIAETKAADKPLTTAGVVKVARQKQQAKDQQAVADVVDAPGFPEADAEIARTRLLVQFSEGTAAGRKLILLHVDAVAGVLPRSRRSTTLLFCQDMRAWCDRLETAMGRELRIVGGSDD